MSLLGKLTNPQVLMGLGLLGSETQDQASRYMQGAMGILQAERDRKQKLEDAERLREQQLADQQAQRDWQAQLMANRFAMEHAGALQVAEQTAANKPRRIIKDANNRQRYEDDLSLVFPDLAVAPDTEAAFDTESKLRGEYDKLSKTFREQTASYQRLIDSAKDPSAAGDLALVFNYMKILDPGSTVREGEFATARNAGGVESKLRSLYNSVIDGRILTHKQRADFVNRAGRMYRGAAQLQTGVDDRYTGLAGAYKVAPENILFSPNVEMWEYPSDLIDELPEGRSIVERVVGDDGKTYYRYEGDDSWYTD